MNLCLLNVVVFTFLHSLMEALIESTLIQMVRSKIKKYVRHTTKITYKINMEKNNLEIQQV